MSPEVYLQGVIDKYSVNPLGAVIAGSPLLEIVKKWANTYLVKTSLSGSISKGTAISLCADADYFISLSSLTPNTLAEIHETLYDAVTNAGYVARKQNVSIGVNVNNLKIDLVPGKRQSQYGNDHSLYRRKANTWTKTNIDTHISTVRTSNRQSEIKLAKIWRELHGLDFPSFYLEMAVIAALKKGRIRQLGNNFWKVLEFFIDLPTQKYTDPANTNNIISDDLTLSEKKLVAAKAVISRNQQNWGTIVW